MPARQHAGRLPSGRRGFGLPPRAAFAPGARVAAAARSIATRRWVRVLGVGLTLWITALAVTKATDDSIVVPSDVMLGAFLVPLTVLAWSLDKLAGSELSGRRVLLAMIVGGSLSMLLTVPLEYWLLPGGALEPPVVGLIEELTKLLALAAAALGLRRLAVRDGIVLGGAIGCGFSAFESSGYALNSMALQSTVAQTSLTSLIQNEAARSLTAPFTHALWTAIAGGALFWAAGHGWRLRRVPGLIGAYLLVAAFHAYWDSSAALTQVLLRTMARRGVHAALLLDLPSVGGSMARALTFNGVWIVLVALSSCAALAVLLLLWRGGGAAGEVRLSACGD